MSRPGAGRFVALGLAGAALLSACALQTPTGAASPSVSAAATVPVGGSATARPPGPTGSPCRQVTKLARWPVSRLAAQVLVAPAQLADVAASARQVASGVGGLILFGSSVPVDLREQLRQLERLAPHGIPPLVMTDEEGGAVQRMAGLVGPVPSARRMAATMTPAQVERLARRVGDRLKRASVTMDLAPVLDLDAGDGPGARDPDGTRSFGTDPATTAADGLAFAAGLREAGVIAVVKHFPGLGSASGNTDDGPAATVPWATLSQVGLAPFRDAVAAGIPAVMVANATVPGLTPLPASISPAVVTTVLRDELGFTGLVMTDSVSAGALTDIGDPVPVAAVAALAAGDDLVLFGTGVDDDPRLTDRAVAAITAAVRSGALPRRTLVDAADHVLAAKGIDLCVSRDARAQGPR